MIAVTIVGERIEIAVFEDSQIEFSNISPNSPRTLAASKTQKPSDDVSSPDTIKPISRGHRTLDDE
jgi:hypothetical protein